MTHPDTPPPADGRPLEDVLRAISDTLALTTERLALVAERQTDATTRHTEQLTTQTAALTEVAESVADATASINAREFARIAEKSEARLSGYAGGGMLALLVALASASQLRIPIWNGRVPEWMAEPAGWTAAAYAAVAILIAVTRLGDTRFLLNERINAAATKRYARQRARASAAAPAPDAS